MTRGTRHKDNYNMLNMFQEQHIYSIYFIHYYARDENCSAMTKMWDLCYFPGWLVLTNRKVGHSSHFDLHATCHDTSSAGIHGNILWPALWGKMSCSYGTSHITAIFQMTVVEWRSDNIQDIPNCGCMIRSAGIYSDWNLVSHYSLITRDNWKLLNYHSKVSDLAFDANNNSTLPKHI